MVAWPVDWREHLPAHQQNNTRLFAMGAGRNKSHRKKRISKHVLESVERKKLANVEAGLLAAAGAAEAAGGGGTSLPPAGGASVGVEATRTTTTGGGKESSSRRERKLKDPAEASTYLSSWKYDRADINNTTSTTTKRWKFNKNTQSWLLRHMYDGDRVNKATFAMLLEYIIAGKCDGVRSKVREDAKVRARRYKEWETTEKEMKTTLALPKKKEDEGASSSRRPISSGGVEAKRSGGLAGVAIAATTTTANDEWKTMDEREKRRVYKRARKVLDTLKTKNEGGIEQSSVYIKC